jgi:hypothetical protein
MLHWTQVWKHMRDLTNRDIEKRAVMEFISFFEKQIDLVISQSVKELDKKNRLCEIQGLRQKQRIDQKCIREAIKTINNNDHSSLSKRTGDVIQKVKKESNKYSQENTEVA